MALTRREMEQVIAEGGSVMHGSRIITRVADLPTEADLARGDTALERAAAASLDAQIAALLAQRATLGGAAPETAQGAAGTATAPTGGESTGTPPALLTSIDAATVGKLGEAGFTTREQLQGASDEQLLAVPGVGDATLRKIRAELGA